MLLPLWESVIVLCFCCTLLYIHSSIAIIIIGKGELVALLNFSCCLVMVEWLILAVQWGCLRFVIVVFPDHTYLLFFCDNLMNYRHYLHYVNTAYKSYLVDKGLV